jgi:hypothetical protein
MNEKIEYFYTWNEMSNFISRNNFKFLKYDTVGLFGCPHYRLFYSDK